MVSASAVADVKAKLQAQGALHAIRAQLRARVYAAVIGEKGETAAAEKSGILSLTKSVDGRLALALLDDFMHCAGLESMASVAAAEIAGWDERSSRADAAVALKLSSADGGSGAAGADGQPVPLLLQLVGARREPSSPVGPVGVAERLVAPSGSPLRDGNSAAASKRRGAGAAQARRQPNLAPLKGLAQPGLSQEEEFVRDRRAADAEAEASRRAAAAEAARAEASRAAEDEERRKQSAEAARRAAEDEARSRRAEVDSVLAQAERARREEDERLAERAGAVGTGGMLPASPPAAAMRMPAGRRAGGGLDAFMKQSVEKEERLQRTAAKAKPPAAESALSPRTEGRADAPVASPKSAKGRAASTSPSAAAAPKPASPPKPAVPPKPAARDDDDDDFIELEAESDSDDGVNVGLAAPSPPKKPGAGGGLAGGRAGGRGASPGKPGGGSRGPTYTLEAESDDSDDGGGGSVMRTDGGKARLAPTKVSQPNTAKRAPIKWEAEPAPAPVAAKPLPAAAAPVEDMEAEEIEDDIEEISMGSAGGGSDDAW